MTRKRRSQKNIYNSIGFYVIGKLRQQFHERGIIMKQWAKREKQIERVMGATVGMYGDLQGTAGKSLQEIEGLSLLALSNEGD